MPNAEIQMSKMTSVFGLYHLKVSPEVSVLVKTPLKYTIAWSITITCYFSFPKRALAMVFF